MELPIINSGAASGVTLIRAVIRARVMLGNAVIESTSLDVGTAFARHDRPGVADANFIAEAHIPSGHDAPDLVGAALAWFKEKNAHCEEWLSAQAAWPSELTSAIVGAGYATRKFVIHRLDRVQLPTDLNPKVQIIPGRAAYPQLRDYYLAQAREHDHADEALAKLMAHTRIEQLDESGYDVFLARIDGQAMGAVGVITVGPVGVIHDLFALGAARGQGIGKSLMHHTLEYCARAQLQTVIVPAPLGCPATPLYAKLGFVPAAEYVTYRRR